MKILITLFLVLFLSSCSHKNAFSEFDMNGSQELSITSLKRIKITKDTQTVGAFNAIYLNEVYPKIYNGDEYFFVYIYLKEMQEISDPNTKNDDKLILTLNDNRPIKLKILQAENRFSNLSSSKNKWNQYYLVSFATEEKKLTLKLESDLSSSVSLSYQKDQQ